MHVDRFGSSSRTLALMLALVLLLLFFVDGTAQAATRYFRTSTQGRLPSGQWAWSSGGFTNRYGGHANGESGISSVTFQDVTGSGYVIGATATRTVDVGHGRLLARSRCRHVTTWPQTLSSRMSCYYVT